MPTIDQIRVEFERARGELATLDGKLADERAEIRRTAFQEGRSLSAQEISRRKEIAATRGELTDALETLALDTLASLDAADDLDSLLHEVNSIIQQLDDDLKDLQQLVDYAKSAESVGKGLATVATALAALRPELA